MTKTNRSWLYFGLSAAVLAVSTVLVGMTNHRSESPEGLEVAKGFSSKELEAKNVLRDELERRFTDRQNVDFGMSRISRGGARLHSGPTMDKQPDDFLDGNQWRSRPGGYETLIEGEWISVNKAKPMMTPENNAEKDAIELLKESGVDVAIYTVGQFELDAQKNPAPDDKRGAGEQNPHLVDFSWGSYNDLRAKGPAYITQKSSTAPRAYEIVEFGRKAWKSGRMDFSAEGKEGWIYFAHRIEAPDMSCAKCHGERQVFLDNTSRRIRGVMSKPGDPVGLFVIAMKKS